MEILTKQEAMMSLLEDQQTDIESLQAENRQIQEELDESLNLNEQLSRQIKTLIAQKERLEEQLATLQNLQNG